MAPADAHGWPEARMEEELCHPRSHLKACLLVLLDQDSGHGYDLFQRMKPLGYEHHDRAVVYRALHWLEAKGLIEPRWDTSGRGPARRIFDITTSGRAVASRCSSELDEQLRAYGAHLVRDSSGQEGPSAEPGRSFEVVVEAKLFVQAPDPASAGRAAQRALGKGRLIAPQVRSGGEVCVYEATQWRQSLSRQE